MPRHYKNINGYFDFEQIYSFAVDRYIKGGIAVEIGSFLGKSTCFFAELIKEKNAAIKFYTVDTFLGERGALDQKKIVEEEGGSIYKKFLHNMSDANVLHYVTPLSMTSKEASELFQNESLDFLFLDAEHIYNDVYEDLEVWFPKMRKDGIMCGHDYYKGSEVLLAVNDFFLKKFNVAPKQINNSFFVAMEWIGQSQNILEQLNNIVKKT